MIIKSYDTKNFVEGKIFLFHGQNDGQKSIVINDFFRPKFKEKSSVNTYFEKDILKDKENFFSSIFSGSFFEEKKLIIIKEATENLRGIVEEITEKEIKDVTIILFSSILEKKSKLRNLFEKDKSLISVAFYPENNQSLVLFANNFFKEKKISISYETVNILVNKVSGNKENLISELNKIEMYLKNKKSISKEEIDKLTNITENNDISEVIDNCLAKNYTKISNLMNENNFSSDDTIIFIRIFLNKAKRLLNLLYNYSIEKDVNKVISNSKPPIFWKDKDIVKKQIKNWNIRQTENLISEINDVELLIKKNTVNSYFILLDFIFSKSKITNN